MLKSLQIQNYQSHKNTQLEFDPGVNAIIGATDSGKSVILRSLNWIFNNRPSGDAFRSTWGGDTVVDIEMEEEIISREKGKENLYTISSQGKQPKEFKAMGQSVPDEIQLLLNIKSINCQFQHDSIFLLSQSPGEIARYLNEIVNLDKIDIALKNIAKQLRGETQNLKQGTFHLSELNEQIQQYDWVNQADGNLIVLENLEKEINRGQKEVYTLKILIEEVSNINREKEQTEIILDAENFLEKQFIVETEISKIRLSKENLIFLYKELEKIDSHLCSARILADLQPDLNFLLTLDNEIMIESNQYFKLEDISKEIEDIETQQKELQIKLKKQEEEFHKLMPSICPLCGHEVKSNIRRKRK